MAKDTDSASKSMPLSTPMGAAQAESDASSPEVITTVAYRLEGLEGTRTIIVHRLTSLNGVISLLLLLWGHWPCAIHAEPSASGMLY